MDYEKGFKMKGFDIEVFVNDLNQQFNDMQDKAIAGSENVATAALIIKNQAKEMQSLLKFIEERGETGQLIIWREKANASE